MVLQITGFGRQSHEGCRRQQAEHLASIAFVPIRKRSVLSAL